MRLLRRLLPAPGPDPATELRRMVLVAVDCEMTGLDPARDSLLAVGAVALRGLRLDLSATFRGLLRPACAVRPEVVPVHGILPGEAAQGEDAAAELARFDSYLSACAATAVRPPGGDAPGVALLGWCLGLDEAFLAAGRRRARLPARPLPRCDVRDLFLHLRDARNEPGKGEGARAPDGGVAAGHGAHAAAERLADIPLKDADLYAVARALGIDAHGAHDALGDACTCAQVFQRLVPLLERRLGGRRACWGDLARCAEGNGRRGGGAFGF